MSATTDFEELRYLELTGPIYIDASALAKLYFAEPESELLNAHLLGRRDLMVSDLAVTEVVSALGRRQREGLLGMDAIRLAQQTILSHLDSNVLQRVELSSACHRIAERLVVQLQSPLRAADALHIALATSNDCATMLTYDMRMSRAAQTMGLIVHPLHRPYSC